MWGRHSMLKALILSGAAMTLANGCAVSRPAATTHDGSKLASAPKAPGDDPREKNLVTFHVGHRDADTFGVDEDDDFRIEDQTVLGAEWILNPVGFSPEFGLYFAFGEEDAETAIGTIEDAETFAIEASLGLRYTFDIQSRVYPYLGGGLSVLAVDNDGSPLSENFIDGGPFVRGGVNVRLTDGVYLGVDWRQLLFSAETVDYTQFTATLSLGF